MRKVGGDSSDKMRGSGNRINIRTETAIICQHSYILQEQQGKDPCHTQETKNNIPTIIYKKVNLK